MSKHTLDDLRSILFDTLKDLRSKDKPMEIDRALAVKEVAQVIVNTAKAEIDHMKLNGGNGSGFIEPTPAIGSGAPTKPGSSRTATGTKTVTALPNGATVTRHRMAG